MTRAETLHFYGRRRGRKLRVTMQRLLDTRLPELRLDPGASPASQFDGAPDDLFLEIGFGGGENLAAIAAARPEAGFIGAEPFVNGVASLLRHIEDGGIYVLFPDPWPKNRHAARRILQPAVLDELARLIKPGGMLVLASDHPVAKSWLLQAAISHTAFSWTARRPADWRSRPEGLVPTRYMQKAEREDRVPNWFLFERRDG